ncbi:calcium-binding protein, partial [Castellaniella defragrans]|uniref:calcium-binding protein n=1 Tax=Castellaniella defragrans TaxID=75697 RepID=UPI00161DE505
ADTLANIAAALPLDADYALTDVASDITTVTVAEAGVIKGATNAGDYTYSIADTLANIAAALPLDADYALTDVAGDITTVTVAEAGVIKGATNAGDYTYSIADTLANIAAALPLDADYALTDVASDITTVTVEKAGVIKGATNAVDYTYNIADTIAAADSMNFSDAAWAGITGVNLTGSAGDQTVTGSAFADFIAGGDGVDTLSGGDGNDTLTGDAGEDTLTGGAGDDTLTGGAEADTFTFIAGTGTTAAAVLAANGTDTITDFKSSDGDILDVSALLTGGLAFIRGEYSTLSAAVDNYNVVVIEDTQNESGGPLDAIHVDTLARAVSNHTGSGILVFDNNGTVQIWYDADMGTDHGGGDAVLIGVIGTEDAAAVLVNLTSYNFI